MHNNGLLCDDIWGAITEAPNILNVASGVDLNFQDCPLPIEGGCRGCDDHYADACLKCHLDRVGCSVAHVVACFD